MTRVAVAVVVGGGGGGSWPRTSPRVDVSPPPPTSLTQGNPTPFTHSPTYLLFSGNQGWSRDLGGK